MFIVLKFKQNPKQKFPIEETLDGIVIALKFTQSLKQNFPILVIPSSSSTFSVFKYITYSSIQIDSS